MRGSPSDPDTHTAPNELNERIMLFQNSGSGRLGVSPANARYLDEMFAAWKADPDSVDSQWQAFFEGFELALGSSEQMAAGIGGQQSKVANLIAAYRRIGHLAAHVNPLDPEGPQEHEDLQLAEYGLSDADLDTQFDTGDIPGNQRATLREIVEFLNETYCSSIGVEFLHIHDEPIRKWMIEQMERNRNRPTYDADRKRYILSNLVDAETFESFLHSRYPGQKRFSMEGAESMIPGLRSITDLAPLLGIEEIVFGMAHRGRLNVLVNIMHKTYGTIFSEFEENFIPGTVGGDADVKYHRGFRSIHTARTRGPNAEVRLTLCANPSHLEAVNPVVEGRTRGKQRQANDTAERKRIVPLLIHGDAAFAGQGLVAETLALAGLPGYSTGGTVHVITNNQIGFTALPHESRSTRYCTDIAKIVEAPVFHVNGDDPEAVVYCCELALRFRHEFGRDVVVDIICYRRHGHNEGDEPNFTQPEMYRKIRALKPTRQLYSDRLLGEGVLNEQEATKIVDDLQDRMQVALDDVRQRDANTRVRYAAAPPASKRPDAEPAWLELDEKYNEDPVATATTQEDLEKVATVLSTVPDTLKINPKLARQVTTRLETIKSNGDIDWAFAELLSFGTLLLDGTPVRLSGQDCERGTFSQRHAIWIDAETNDRYSPLAQLGAAHFCVYNSLLSEAAVLGFDYGYTITEPKMLVLWEAQFGDFANGAQVIIDQFITSSFQKWQRQSGLVMLLPHGYEGQGPEHSNAYLERYLAACAEHNIIVCNNTTPANHFHALRRQMKRKFRRPLVIMSPKSLLRHKLCVSKPEEFVNGGYREIIDDPARPQQVKRVVLCSGKVYYDLAEARAAGEVGQDVALVRVEQLYPLRRDLIKPLLEQTYPGAQLVWCQEEPQNRGAWTHMFLNFYDMLPGRPLRYIGRPAAASPAGGSLKYHKREQAKLISEALDSGF